MILLSLVLLPSSVIFQNTKEFFFRMFISLGQRTIFATRFSQPALKSRKLITLFIFSVSALAPLSAQSVSTLPTLTAMLPPSDKAKSLTTPPATNFTPNIMSPTSLTPAVQIGWNTATLKSTATARPSGSCVTSFHTPNVPATQRKSALSAANQRTDLVSTISQYAPASLFNFVPAASTLSKSRNLTSRLSALSQHQLPSQTRRNRPRHHPHSSPLTLSSLNSSTRQHAFQKSPQKSPTSTKNSTKHNNKSNHLLPQQKTKSETYSIPSRPLNKQSSK